MVNAEASPVTVDAVVQPLQSMLVSGRMMSAHTRPMAASQGALVAVEIPMARRACRRQSVVARVTAAIVVGRINGHPGNGVSTLRNQLRASFRLRARQRTLQRGQHLVARSCPAQAGPDPLLEAVESERTPVEEGEHRRLRQPRRCQRFELIQRDGRHQSRCFGGRSFGSRCGRHTTREQIQHQRQQCGKARN
ncbi:MAG: hypothetical protein CMN57_08225 [Gammaproteobacteria bacterium]|nr:hypothetical protein [Gammaproteobacteria bacterium]